MSDTGKAAIASGSLRDRVRFFAIEPYKEALVAFGLRWTAEVRSLEAVEALRGLREGPVNGEASRRGPPARGGVERRLRSAGTPR